MKKTKLLVPLLGITATAGAIVPLAVSCNKSTEYKITIVDENNACSFDITTVENGKDFEGKLSIKDGYTFKEITKIQTGTTTLASGDYTWTPANDKEVGTLKIAKDKIAGNIEVTVKTEANQPTPVDQHKIIVKNTIVETRDLFDIEASELTFTDEEISKGLSLTFTLKAKGSEPIDNYAFIHTGNIEIKTKDEQTISMTEGYTWQEDEEIDYVWHLTFKKDEQVINALKSSAEMTVSFKVQHFNNLSVSVVDQTDAKVSDDFTINPTSIDIFTFEGTISIAAANTPYTVTSVSVTTPAGGWSTLVLTDDYSIKTWDEYSNDITLTQQGLDKLTYFWWYEQVEILKITINI